MKNILAIIILSGLLHTSVFAQHEVISITSGNQKKGCTTTCQNVYERRCERALTGTRCAADRLTGRPTKCQDQYSVRCQNVVTGKKCASKCAR